MNLLHRRTFLGGMAAAFGALGTFGCGQPVDKKGTFPLGVAAGDATPDGILLWTNYNGEEALDAVVWPEAGELTSQIRLAAHEEEGFIITEVSGLKAGTWYNFHFAAPSGETSPIGRFRTALAPGQLEKLTFAATSCIKHGNSYGALGDAAGRQDIDAFIFLGDAVYTDGAKSLADFRQKWAQGLGEPEYTSLRGSTSMVALWDDHEVRNNWENDSVDPALLDGARRAFLEHQPIRQNAEKPMRYWRSIKWGDTAELFILDARSERNRASGQYLSPEQLDWLVNGVATSTAKFKLILNTVPIGAFDSALFKPFQTDCWLAFPEQRNEFLTRVEATGAKGVIIVSGDFHFGCFGRANRPGTPGYGLFEVLVGPGANHPNPSPTYPHGDPWEFSTAMKNYTTFELDPFTEQMHLRMHGEDGKILFERVLS
jgi:alkaline phosphatase D